MIAGISMTDIPAINHESDLSYERDLRTVTADTRADESAFLRIARNLGLRPEATVHPSRRWT